MTDTILDTDKLIEITDSWFGLAKPGKPKRGQWAQIIRTNRAGDFQGLLYKHHVEIAQAAVFSVHTHRQPFATMRGFISLERRPPQIGELYRIRYIPGRWFQHSLSSLVSECWIERLSKKELQIRARSLLPSMR